MSAQVLTLSHLMMCLPPTNSIQQCHRQKSGAHVDDGEYYSHREWIDGTDTFDEYGTIDGGEDLTGRLKEEVGATDDQGSDQIATSEDVQECSFILLFLDTDQDGLELGRNLLFGKLTGTQLS
jgi:hypothetical protein